MGTCPKCQAPLNRVTVDDVNAGGLKGISYSCPFCSVILSVGIDQLAVKTDTVSEIVSEILRALGKAR